MVKVELFIAPTCPHCPKAKEMVEKVLSHVDAAKINFEIVNVKTPEGLERSKAYKFTTIPTLVVDGDVMSPEFEEWKIAKMIDMKLNPKRSFWQKLFGGA